jgi:hypothetical protein
MDIISNLLSILPHVSKDELVLLYKNCYPTCTICNKDCIPEKTYCKDHIPCEYVMQSGNRKGYTCGLFKCKSHIGLIQCKVIQNELPCLHRCDEGNICLYHKQQEERLKEQSKPIPPIRIHESGYFVIKNTNIVIHIERNQLYGTLVKKDMKWIIERNETNEIKKICLDYHISFQNENI